MLSVHSKGVEIVTVSVLTRWWPRGRSLRQISGGRLDEDKGGVNFDRMCLPNLDVRYLQFDFFKSVMARTFVSLGFQAHVVSVGFLIVVVYFQ